MNAQDWKNKYAPNFPGDPEHALENEARLWSGVTTGILKKHGLTLAEYGSVQNADGESVMDMSDTFLCAFHVSSPSASCRQCPLALALGDNTRRGGCGAEMDTFCDTHSPRKMQALIRKAQAMPLP